MPLVPVELVPLPPMMLRGRAYYPLVPRKAEKLIVCEYVFNMEAATSLHFFSIKNNCYKLAKLS